MQQLDAEIDRILAVPPYSMAPAEKQSVLVDVLREELNRGGQIHAGYKNYIDQWPVDYRSTNRVSELPYLPVGILKADPPLSFISSAEIKRTLTSSATTSQMPSRVVLDAPTSKRMTKGVVSIVRDFIGSARRPYLVVDTADLMKSSEEMGARSAAIQGLNPFASSTTYCLNLTKSGDLALDLEKLKSFAEAHRDENEVLVYGFTYILWQHLVKPLLSEGLCLNLKNVRILHSGGWKRLQDQAVEKSVFNEQLAHVVGCSPKCIIDFYGMVESVGVIFPDCPEGNKHSPSFAEVIVRNPLTLEPVAVGEHGVVQVCSILPTSFPGNLLLTEDLAQVISDDGCPCGRRGISFRFAGRIPKVEVRGCGNIQVNRVAKS
jgi:Acyl-protein synthetase, LuxE